MTRSQLQFVVGLALGFLTVAVLGGPVTEAMPWLLANAVAGAAATMIAPRLWWLGVLALWLGQSAAEIALLRNGATGGVETAFLAALQSRSAASATPILFGAILGAFAWFIVERRRVADLNKPDAG